MNILQIDKKYHVELEVGEESSECIEKVHIDYGIKATIRKTSNDVDIPDNEPKVIFRGKDRLAIPLLLKYLELCEEDKCTPYQLDGCVELIRRFQMFTATHPDAMKQPGSTKGL
jgi:hypothetical protein